MNGQLSLFSMDLNTPVASEPAPEVVISDVIAAEQANDDDTLARQEATKEAVLSLAEKAGMTPDQADERIIVAFMSPVQEEQPESVITPQPANDETVLSPVIGVESPAEETTQLTDEIDDHIANETVSFLPRLIDLEEEEQQAATVLPAVVPVIPPEKQFDLILKAHWANSMDLAYCMINIALPEDEEYLFDDFTTYVKAGRLADTGNGTRPKADERFDRLAWCLHQMEFSKIEHGGKGKVVRTETNVLDLAIDLCFDEDELHELREFGVRGASGERVSQLAWAIKTYVERDNDEVRIPASAPDAPEIVQNVQNMLDDIKASTYVILFDRLGVAKKDYPDFSNMDSVLSALLDAIGNDEHRLDLVLSYSDITEKQLFKAAEKDIETKRRLLEIARKQLKRDLNGFYATGEWHHHRCFARYPVFLTDGTLYLAEHGGAGATTAYWLMDVIASYQGEKQMKRIENPQLWKIECFGEGGKRSCVVACGNNPNKPIIKQEIEWTNFLLNEYELYGSLEPFDESGRLALIISLIAER